MNNKKSHPGGGTIGLMLIGFGIMGLGVYGFMILNNSSKASVSDFQAVPASVDFVPPKMEFLDMYHNEVSLDDYSGLVLLVNLWASWCPPCREEMPTLQAFYDKYKQEGFLLIAINQGETREVIEPFVREFEISFPVWLDRESLAGRGFDTINLPSSYVIDRSGRVRLMWIGGISGRNLEKYVPMIIRK